MSNNGKLSEELFEKKILKEDQDAYVYRFEDHAKLNYGKLITKRIVPSKPSDYLVTQFGHTFYAEVKSTINARFPFANLKRGQWRSGTKQLKAKGEYFVFIHFLTSNSWYKVPFNLFLETKRKSFTEACVAPYHLPAWKLVDINK